MAIFEREETYVQWTTVKDRNSVLTVPSSISISITNPCDTVLVNAVAMTNDAVGKYYYNYNIAVDAPFGEYSVVVRTESAGGSITKQKDRFYILPWDITDKIRSVSGIGSEKSISDDDIAQIAWDTYKEVLNDVFYYHHNENIGCSCGVSCVGSCANSEIINGTNTSFHTRYRPIADHDGSGTVHGEDAATCDHDITGYWIDSSCDCQTAYITVNSSECGDITITQTSGAAIPSSAKTAYITYWSEPPYFDKNILKQAVLYLASYRIGALRFQELGRATQADLQNVQNQSFRKPELLLKEYKRLRGMIGIPTCGGTH